VGSSTYWLDSNEQKDLCALVKSLVFAFALNRVQLMYQFSFVSFLNRVKV